MTADFDVDADRAAAAEGTGGLTFDTRTSPSPWIATVWTSEAERVAEMTSVANETWGLVWWREDGRRCAGLVGPESRSSSVSVPQGTSFTGIQFALGTSLRVTDTLGLVDSQIALPDVTRRGFWLDGRRWEIPHPDDAETFVDRLAADGVLVRDPVVTETLAGGAPSASARAVERRFRAATGLTRGSIRQIERVRAAATLLAGGSAVADVVDGLGYYDEPHLARMLRRYIGRTAQQLRVGVAGPLSLDTAQRTTS